MKNRQIALDSLAPERENDFPHRPLRRWRFKPRAMSTSTTRPVVLLVEDSDDDAFFFRHALKKTGFQCTLVHAADGAIALQHFRTAIAGGADAPAWPDLVFLDLKLPRFTGFEILAWIREQGVEAKLDVAILSGSEHSSDIERAMALGALDYFVKPVRVEQLAARLFRWSEKHALQKADAAGNVSAGP